MTFNARTLLAVAAARSRQEAEEMRMGACLADTNASLMEDILANGSDEDVSEMLRIVTEVDHVG